MPSGSGDLHRALLAIDVDNAAERGYLALLAARLGLRRVGAEASTPGKEIGQFVRHGSSSTQSIHDRTTRCVPALAKCGRLGESPFHPAQIGNLAPDAAQM